MSLIWKRNPKQTAVHNRSKEPHELVLRRSRTTTRAGHGRRAGGPGARRNDFKRHTDLARRDGKLAALRPGQGRRYAATRGGPDARRCRSLFELRQAVRARRRDSLRRPLGLRGMQADVRATDQGRRRVAGRRRVRRVLDPVRGEICGRIDSAICRNVYRAGGRSGFGRVEQVKSNGGVGVALWHGVHR